MQAFHRFTPAFPPGRLNNAFLHLSQKDTSCTLTKYVNCAAHRPKAEKKSGWSTKGRGCYPEFHRKQESIISNPMKGGRASLYLAWLLWHNYQDHNSDIPNRAWAQGNLTSPGLGPLLFMQKSNQIEYKVPDSVKTGWFPFTMPDGKLLVEDPIRKWQV